MEHILYGEYVSVSFRFISADKYYLYYHRHQVAWNSAVLKYSLQDLHSSRAQTKKLLIRSELHEFVLYMANKLVIAISLHKTWKQLKEIA